MATTVAVLGAGIMGTGIAQSMLRAGLLVRVYNRSAEKARPLANDGAMVCDSAREAVTGADVVVTILFDTESVEAVMTDAIDAVAPHAVWVQSSTVGLDGVARLADLADKHGVNFLDAPVLGTKGPAHEGTLTVLVGGDESLRQRVDPAFNAIGANTVWVGAEIGAGHRLKLVANSWVLSVVSGTAQALALAQALDVDPRQFLAAIDSGPLNAAYVQIKGDAMLTGDLAPSFELDGASKDAGLIAAALDSSGVASDVMQAVQARLAAASAAGYGARDMSAIIHGFR